VNNVVIILGERGRLKLDGLVFVEASSLCSAALEATRLSKFRTG